MIPVCKPDLPEADTLYPYLREIDANRFYTNFGPLTRRLEVRIAERLETLEDAVVTASSGMLALEVALMAMDLPGGSYALLPSWTFIATAQAVRRCGLEPLFADIDHESWTLTPAYARRVVRETEKNVSVVIPVVPFGVPVTVTQWRDFMQESGTPVLIDGATLALNDIEVSDVPIMISMHATKLLNAGEGGLVICNDTDFTSRVRHISNFALAPDGVTMTGTNAKLSEYHAAIGNASLDDYERVLEDFFAIAQRYRDKLGDKLRFLPGYGTIRGNSFCLAESELIDEQALHNAGISTRGWWRRGVHREPAFADCARADDLTATEHIAQIYTGLPCFRDMDTEQIDTVCETVSKQIDSFKQQTGDNKP